MENRRNLPGLLGAVLVIVGSFLPWVTVFGQTMNGMSSGAGTVIIVLGVLLGLFAMLAKRWAAWAGVVVGLLTVLWAFKQIADVGSVGEAAGTGIGLWVILAGAAIGTIGCLMAALRRRAEPVVA